MLQQKPISPAPVVQLLDVESLGEVQARLTQYLEWQAQLDARLSEIQQGLGISDLLAVDVFRTMLRAQTYATYLPGSGHHLPGSGHHLPGSGHHLAGSGHYLASSGADAWTEKDIEALYVWLKSRIKFFFDFQVTYNLWLSSSIPILTSLVLICIFTFFRSLSYILSNSVKARWLHFHDSEHFYDYDEFYTKNSTVSKCHFGIL